MPRISYYPVDKLDDPELLGYLEDAARHGAPRPESQAIRAHVPAVLRSFSQNWQRIFRTGVVEHSLKELCRVYVSKTIDCPSGDHLGWPSVKAGSLVSGYAACPGSSLQIRSAFS